MKPVEREGMTERVRKDVSVGGSCDIAQRLIQRVVVVVDSRQLYGDVRSKWIACTVQTTE